MAKTMREKIEAEIQEVAWEAIRPHAERDAVILVSQDLDLLDAAEKVAIDDKTVVSDWIAQQLLAKPSPGDLSAWDGEPQRRFRFIILSPYVLIQSLAH